MGTTGLGQLVPNQPDHLANYAGTRVAIDAPNLLTTFLHGIRNEIREPFRNHEGHVTSHILGLLRRHGQLLQNGVLPVYVFDGGFNPLKAPEQARRREERRKNQEKAAEAEARGDINEAIRLRGFAMSLDAQMLQDAKRVIELLGSPIVMAPGEGEAEAARLVSEGVCSALATQDHDAILFNCQRVLRDVIPTGEAVRTGILDAEKALGIKRQDLVDACILAGCDFAPGADRIGVKSGLALVQKHSGLEGILKASGKKEDVVKAYLQSIDWMAVRAAFMQPVVGTGTPAEQKPIDEDLPRHLVQDLDIPLHSAPFVDAWMRRPRPTPRQAVLA